MEYALPITTTWNYGGYSVAEDAVPEDIRPSFSLPPRKQDATTVETTDLEAAPWLAGAVEQLNRMRGLTPGWETSGALPPNETAIKLASMVLLQLMEAEIEPNYIDPSTDEGVCVAFRHGDRYADVECFNTGEILAVTKEGGRSPNIWDVHQSDIRQALGRIARFIH